MVRTILIADDDEDDVFLLRDVLKATDLINPVQIVTTGEDTIDYLAGNGAYADRDKYPYPTLLFLDLNMPKKNGLEVMEWVQSNREQHPLGVIMLTGLSSASEMRRAYELGVHSFLIKPLQFDDFKHLVTYLDGLQVRQSEQGFSLSFDTERFRAPR